MDDKFQVDYLPDEKKIKINLPEEVWRNIDTVKPKNKHNAEFIAEAREGWPHAIERALKAEALARELVDMLERATPRYLAGRLELDLDLVHEANGLLKKAKEVLGNE